MNISIPLLIAGVVAWVLQCLFRLALLATAVALAITAKGESFLPHVALIFLLWFAWRAIRLLEEMIENQNKQSMILGGIRHYLKLEMPVLPMEQTPDNYPKEITLTRMLWIGLSRAVMGKDFTKSVVTGTDIFETKFKRGQHYVSIQDDVGRARDEK